MDRHKGIDSLLNLDGMVIEQTGGYWTKFEARQLNEATEERPHGIRYSLTLHDRYGTRVMGFDNAHSVKASKKGRYRGRKTYDHHHRHVTDEGIPYEFVDAYQLLEDFWAEVDKMLKKLGEV
jgi:Family of unknown function (DUF6516)